MRWRLPVRWRNHAAAAPPTGSFDPRGMILAGGVVALCAAFRAEWPIAAVCVVLRTAGMLRSIQTAAFATLAFAEVPADRYRPANSLFVACRPLATVVGMAVGVAFLDMVSATGGRAVPEPADFG